MTDAVSLIEQAPLQDRDLLQRLSAYFDGFEHRLRHGQGWFIFNAGSGRSDRIATFIGHRLADYRTSVDSYVVSWRDFALSAYVNEVGLPELTPDSPDGFRDSKAKQEYELAKSVTSDICDRLMFSDLVVLTGLQPRQRHEAILLDRTIDERYRHRLATILVTPEMPNDLQAGFASVDPSDTFWPRLFQRMYETSLVAL